MSRVISEINRPVLCRPRSDSVFGGGPGVRNRPELQLAEEVLWSGLSGQRQPTEVLLHQSVRHQGEWDLVESYMRTLIPIMSLWLEIKLGETAGLPLFHKIHLPVMCLLFFPTRLLRWVINTQIWHWFWLPRPQQKANKSISQLILAWKTYPTWLNITTLHIKMYSTDNSLEVDILWVKNSLK